MLAVITPMLLVIGDSYAHWASSRCQLREGVQAAGRRGARIADDEFRRWAIRVAHHVRPQDALLIIGGNDMAHEHFSPRLLGQHYEELVLGLLAAGVGFVHILPIPPRSASRPGSVPAPVYRRRRRLTNQVLRRLFCRPVAAPCVAMCEFPMGDGFLGRDGVHPSEDGWRRLQTLISHIAAISA
ncbi:hypothetical protein FJT64_006347 [Amphibalanus amphitrite]|uniref:SGNH hydrolase-type esterase domain-containing protein n=1 Tax=Amphibalanus amphitrite TaxID=1232801 RepID=A0A6A4W2I1_AMPAM|nr:hypothetical protein FJT64_006347 [Amphibalanus amphitrite]